MTRAAPASLASRVTRTRVTRAQVAKARLASRLATRLRSQTAQAAAPRAPAAARAATRRRPAPPHRAILQVHQAAVQAPTARTPAPQPNMKELRARWLNISPSEPQPFFTIFTSTQQLAFQRQLLCSSVRPALFVEVSAIEEHVFLLGFLDCLLRNLGEVRQASHQVLEARRSLRLVHLVL